MAKIKKLDHDEVSYFCEQLSLIINAGIPLSEGTEMIGENADDGAVTAVAGEMAAHITEGATLFEAMEQCGAFPPYAVNMVKIGTLSGRLDDVLKGLSEYYEQTADRLRNIRSAVLHPLILIAMMAVVMLVLILQVIPMFSDIFGQFDSPRSRAGKRELRLYHGIRYPRGAGRDTAGGAHNRAAFGNTESEKVPLGVRGEILCHEESRGLFLAG